MIDHTPSDAKWTLVFAVDDRFVPHLLVALESFCEFNDPRRYRVCVLHAGFASGSVGDLRAFEAQTGLELVLHETRNAFESFRTGFHFNPTIFLRLHAPVAFRDVSRLLYVDADVVFQASVEQLFLTELGENEFAAVERSFAPVPAHMARWCTAYFASGLLVMNVPRLVQRDFEGDCINWLSENYYEMPDQDVFNAVARGIVKLPLHFSVETELVRAGERGEYSCPPDRDVIIWQFSAGDKPWNFRTQSPKKALYWRYRRRYAARLPLARRLRLLLPDGILAYVKSTLQRLTRLSGYVSVMGFQYTSQVASTRPVSLPVSKYWSAFEAALREQSGGTALFRWPQRDLTCESNWPVYQGGEKNHSTPGVIGFGPGANYGEAVAEFVSDALAMPDVKFLVVNCHPYLRLGLSLRDVGNIVVADVSLTASELALNSRQVSLPSLSLLGRDDAGEVRPSSARPLLASFQGTETHRVRSRLKAIESDSIVINVFQDDWRGVPSQSERATRRTTYLQLLRDSRFSFVPRGHALFSYRLAEVLQCGSIPVFIADQWVPPLHRVVDWSKCSLTFGEGEVLQIPRVLSALRPDEVAEMQQHARRVYETYFATVSGVCNGVVAELNAVSVGRGFATRDIVPRLEETDWDAHVRSVAESYEGIVPPLWVRRVRRLLSLLRST